MFNKYQSNYVLSINGISKDVYRDSWEDGEGEYVGTHDIRFMNEKFNIEATAMTIEKIQSVVINHIKKELYISNIKVEWLFVGDNDHISFNIMEDRTAEPIEPTKEVYENKEVYSCRYCITLDINGIGVKNDDLIKIFPMCV